MILKFAENIGNINDVAKTIVNFNVFLRKPSPLNVFWSLAIDINGFWVVPPLLSMVFSGQEQLVEQWNGLNGSFSSILLDSCGSVALG